LPKNQHYTPRNAPESNRGYGTAARLKREWLAMPDIVVNALEPQDHACWAELWRGYLEFYETSCRRRFTSTPGGGCLRRKARFAD
jgi:hypothetical protein